MIFSNRKIFNIISKQNNTNNGIYVNIVQLEYVIAEKMLAFERLYKNNIEPTRRTRHLYDIYSIFNSKLLQNNKQTWEKIKSFYEWIYQNVQLNAKELNSFKDNYIFNLQILNNLDVINSLDKLITHECYSNVSCKKVISWFKDLIKDQVFSI